MNDLRSFLPWTSLIIGIGGSLHCVGMCGGLVTSCCHNNKDIVLYQIGRLGGYLLLGLLAGIFGSYLKVILNGTFLTYAPSILVGSLFIYWGIQNYRGIESIKSNNNFLSTTYQKIWKKFVFKNVSVSKSFITGFISLLLPCGLLYGVILATIAIQDKSLAILSVLFFWIGTLPAMMLAPGIVKKFLNPLKLHKPKIYAISLMLIGLITIGYRFHGQMFPDTTGDCACHQNQK